MTEELRQRLLRFLRRHGEVPVRYKAGREVMGCISCSSIDGHEADCELVALREELQLMGRK